MDRDLVEAARNGDRAAYVDLIRARTDRLFAIAQRILRDIDRAEDALQDALVIAWRDLRGLRDPDRFDAWLQRLLVNVCIAQATRERRRTANLRVLAGRRTGRARRPAHLRRPGPARTRVPPAAARPTGDPRAPSLPRLRATEIAETLGIPPARPARDSITPIAPCGPPSRRTLGPRSGKVVRHDPATATSNDFSTTGSPTARTRHPIASSTSSPTGSTPTPATRLAPPLEALPVNPLREDRGRRRRPSSIVAVVGYNLLPGGSTGVGGPAPSAESRSPTASSPPPGERRVPDVVHAATWPAAGSFRRAARRPVLRARFTFTVPEGWVNSSDEGGFYGLFPDTAAMLPNTLPPAASPMRSSWGRIEPVFRLRGVARTTGADCGRDGRRRRGQ